MSSENTTTSIIYTKNAPQQSIDNRIEEFYELKMKYEKEKEKIRNKITSNNKSLKEKKREYVETIPKCINCNRKVGMFFDISSNTLMALCGASSGKYKNKKGEPIKECNLNISINLPDYYDIEDIISEYSSVLSKLKKKLKVLKLKHLYDYIDDDESLSLYDEIIKEYKNTSDVFSSLKVKQLEEKNNLKEDLFVIENEHTQLMNSIIDGFKEAQENQDISREIKKKIFRFYKRLFEIENEIRNKKELKTFFVKDDDGYGSSTFYMRNLVVENEVII